jgi:D-glycero-D-manno-heptose 1,7-bisphosphate phosphatase
LTSFALEIQAFFHKFNFAAAVASNQSGISRGFFTVEAFQKFTLDIVNFIDKDLENFFCIVCCPHLPNENCSCRKPKTGMIDEIINQGNFTKALMVGNSDSDLFAAKNAGIEYLSAVDHGASKKFGDWIQLNCDRK